MTALTIYIEYPEQLLRIIWRLWFSGNGECLIRQQENIPYSFSKNKLATGKSYKVGADLGTSGLTLRHYFQIALTQRPQLLQVWVEIRR